MLFQTARCLQLNPRQLELNYDQIKINVTETYTYLGSTLDPHLNFGDNFDEKYNNASYKLRLLYNIIHLLSTKTFSLTNNNVLYHSYEIDYETIGKAQFFGESYMVKQQVKYEQYQKHYGEVYGILVRKCLNGISSNTFNEHIKHI